ncbi:MAG: phosphocarrier protein HPr, partial [Candidatus Schekmanbacteria bacterium RBG_13_48_7]
MQNFYGLHARAAAILVTKASKFKSRIEIEKDGQIVDGKSIMGILMLAAAKGTQITIRAEGSDESIAFEELSNLLSKDFEEEYKK